jgi:hypothetical protein
VASSISRNRFIKDFIGKLREYREVSDEEEDQLSDSIDRLYDLQGYPFTALELSPALTEEQVAEVFVRINSTGKSLSRSDFILTLMSVFWDDGRKELERFCREARVPSAQGASSFNYFIKTSPDQLLWVSIGLGFRRAVLRYGYSILRGKDLETEQFSEERREAQFDVLKDAQEYVLNLQNWHEFFKAIVRAGYRNSKLITSEMSVMYAYMLYLIGKRDYKADGYALGNAMARWFFMISLTGRYTTSPESIMERDLARFRGVSDAEEFIATLDGLVQDTFTEDYWNITFPNQLESSSIRTPAFNAYVAALNLLDAKVLFSKVKVSELLDPVSRANKAPIEVHHLFPKAFLKRSGITETRDTNQVANYALVEWSDNISITDSSPINYFPEYCKRYSAEELAEMSYWHALPDGRESMPYTEFLKSRRAAMARVVRDGFERLREDDSPPEIQPNDA